MSVNQSALSCVPSQVTATNAESGSVSMLASWKGMCSSWEQETADAAGKAAVGYAIKWNGAVVPAIEEKIAKFQADYDANKAEYDAVKEQYDVAERAVRDAQDDMEACKGYKEESGPWKSGGSTDREKVILDHYGYNKAKNREAAAKAEANRYKGQVDKWMPLILEWRMLKKKRKPL
ncbi:hypothetical protein [uncultured Treponema sp.]|uniref:hypothetical protein n=1 Tax=uncultured Treponema sp. TaxID=162155 RepID=UPI0015BB4A5D|nr:hypothetical protein [uncultured Treponema sp.]